MAQEGKIRERDYRRRKLAMLALITALAVMTMPLLQAVGTADVVFPTLSHAPSQLGVSARIGAFVVFVTVLALVSRWNWLISDEVRRSHLIGFWAAIGVAMPLTMFGFMFFGDLIPEPVRLQLAFLAPLMLGCLFAGARWLRDGYVP